MGRRLVTQISVRDPATQRLESYGPGSRAVPGWVREVAAGDHLWVDDVTGEVGSGVDVDARAAAADAMFGTQPVPVPEGKPRRARPRGGPVPPPPTGGA